MKNTTIQTTFDSWQTRKATKVPLARLEEDRDSATLIRSSGFVSLNSVPPPVIYAPVELTDGRTILVPVGIPQIAAAPLQPVVNAVAQPAEAGPNPVAQAEVPQIPNPTEKNEP